MLTYKQGDPSFLPLIHQLATDARPLEIKMADAQYVTDEYGRPFVILREQQKKSRLHGIEAHKVRFSLIMGDLIVVAHGQDLVPHSCRENGRQRDPNLSRSTRLGLSLLPLTRSSLSKKLNHR